MLKARKVAIVSLIPLVSVALPSCIPENPYGMKFSKADIYIKPKSATMLEASTNSETPLTRGETAQSILDSISASAVANVRDYGAKGNGVVDDTSAIQAAADALASVGGGRLLFPAGTYNTGDFTYADGIVLYGMPGSKFRFENQLVDIPTANDTNGTMEYFVSPTGGATNHGLTASCPSDRISTVLKRMPRSLWHDVVITVADGVYLEDAMLDEYGRKTGLSLDGFTIHATRNPTAATYPTSKPWVRNQKGAKLSIVGSKSNNVIIQGRPDAVPYEEGTHPKNGLISRVRDLWVKGITFKNYDQVLVAHEGGAISAWDVKIRNSGTAAVLVESQQAKLEASYLDVNSAGSYAIRVINGQLVLSNATLAFATNGPGLLVEQGYAHFSGTMRSSDSAVRVGVHGRNSLVKLAGTFDKASVLSDGGTTSISNATIKNSTAAVQVRGGSVDINTSHLFDNKVGVQLYAGHLKIEKTDSMDGDTQKYNTEAGVEVFSGYFRYTSYDVNTLGNTLMGPLGFPEKKVLFQYGTVYPIENVPNSTAEYSSTGWSAGSLGADMNRLLRRAKAPTNPTQGTTLYAAWNGLSDLTGYHVVDCNTRLTEFADTLRNAGQIADANVYKVTTTVSNSKLSHDLVRRNFNLLLHDLSRFGLMKPGENSGQLTASASLDFPSVAAGGSQELKLKVPGVDIGDHVSASPINTMDAGLVWNAWVSDVDTITIRITNVTSGQIDPPSHSWTVSIRR